MSDLIEFWYASTGYVFCRSTGIVTEGGDHCFEAPGARDEDELRTAVMVWLQGRRQGHEEGIVSQRLETLKALGLPPSLLANPARE